MAAFILHCLQSVRQVDLFGAAQPTIATAISESVTQVEDQKDRNPNVGGQERRRVEFAREEDVESIY